MGLASVMPMVCIISHTLMKLLPFRLLPSFENSMISIVYSMIACPGVAVTCVMLITTILVTLVMVMLWNLPLPISLLFFCFYGFIEGAYLTSVLNKVLEGGWVPFALSLSILIIMLSWIYGRMKKYEYEVSRKVSKDELQKLLCDENMLRVPGVCLFYSDLVDGISPLIRHYVRCTGTLHQVLVFITIRNVPVPTILAEKRFVVDRLAYKKGVYRSGQQTNRVFWWFKITCRQVLMVNP